MVIRIILFQLLRPIKDLTANWNIPLAEYLENYYEELTELQIDILETFLGHNGWVAGSR